MSEGFGSGSKESLSAMEARIALTFRRHHDYYRQVGGETLQQQLSDERAIRDVTGKTDSAACAVADIDGVSGRPPYKAREQRTNASMH